LFSSCGRAELLAPNHLPASFPFYRTSTCSLASARYAVKGVTVTDIERFASGFAAAGKAQRRGKSAVAAE
jgi:hypothetical protein